MNRFDGRVAIVTGGGGGIGSATVDRLVSEGARVGVADINGEAAESVAARHGEKAIAVTFDAVDAASIERMVSRVVGHFGQLDVLYNNAALTTPASLQGDLAVVDVPLELWDLTMATNARGYLAACKVAIPLMLGRGGGAIVNMASGAGTIGENVRTAYGASKAAIGALTRSVATQYGRVGIRCNAIAPGLIVTPNVRKAAPEMLDMMRRHILTPELGEPRDAAALVAFLASDDARYINGQTIFLDGGLLAHSPHTVDT